MHDYYFRGDDENEVIIQATGNTKNPLSIRVTEGESETAMVNLPEEEIDRIIAGLQEVKRKIRLRG